MIQGRVDWDLEPNELSRALARKHARAEPVLDLTVSNPTRVGLVYPERTLLEAVACDGVLVYEPDPKGLPIARAAVARYYGSLGTTVDAEDLVLTSSTSEAYAFVFKLLGRAGDEVLVPRPGYPLFDYLAALEALRPVPYPLAYDGAWSIDFGALSAAITPRSRAVLVVHPGNPTGAYVSRSDRKQLLSLCAERGVALVSDEVFLDYPLGGGAARESFAAVEEGLVFVLGGLSKMSGLPQLKLSWIAIRGGAEERGDARLRLEHLADHYLSVGAAVQHAAPVLLDRIAPRMRQRISDRTRAGLERLRELVGAEPSVSLLPPEGGWYATLRLPAIQSSPAWALDLLESRSVHVHPGSLFGFPRDAYLVLSLLTPTDVLARGVSRALRLVSARMKAPHV